MRRSVGKFCYLVLYKGTKIENVGEVQIKKTALRHTEG